MKKQPLKQNRFNWANLVEKLAELRKNWQPDEYREAYPQIYASVLIEFSNTKKENRIKQELHDRMSEHIYHTYDIELVEECLENEK